MAKAKVTSKEKTVQLSRVPAAVRQPYETPHHSRVFSIAAEIPDDPRRRRPSFSGIFHHSSCAESPENAPKIAHIT